MPECTTSNSMHGWSKWPINCCSTQLGFVAGHHHEEENEGYSEMLYTIQKLGQSFAEMSVISSGQQWNKKITTWHHHKEEGRVCATHRQGGWDSDLTRIMLPRLTNDRPGQWVMQTNSCETKSENLRMCMQTLFRPDFCDIYHNRYCRLQIVVITHSDLNVFDTWRFSDNILKYWWLWW